MEDLKRSALSALEAGLSVFPADAKTKKPLVSSWKPYQDHLPSERQVETWWTRWSDAAIDPKVIGSAIARLAIAVSCKENFMALLRLLGGDVAGREGLG